jgi:hypothetical protein
VKGVSRREDTYRVKCSNGERLIPKVVLAAEQAGITVRGVTVLKPTLDEVFLELTGHAYREEGELPRPEPTDGAEGSPEAGGGHP